MQGKLLPSMSVIKKRTKWSRAEGIFVQFKFFAQFIKRKYGTYGYLPDLMRSKGDL